MLWDGVVRGVTREGARGDWYDRIYRSRRSQLVRMRDDVIDKEWSNGAKRQQIRGAVETPDGKRGRAAPAWEEQNISLHCVRCNNNITVTSRVAAGSSQVTTRSGAICTVTLASGGMR